MQIVYVSSEAPFGGDGSFVCPFRTITEAAEYWTSLGESRGILMLTPGIYGPGDIPADLDLTIVGSIPILPAGVNPKCPKIRRK